MTSRFTELSIDCHDPGGLATFWSAVLGYRIIDERADLVEIGPWEPTVETIRPAVCRSEHLQTRARPQRVTLRAGCCRDGQTPVSEMAMSLMFSGNCPLVGSDAAMVAFAVNGSIM